jgi:hypothetical protein
VDTEDLEEVNSEGHAVISVREEEQEYVSIKDSL